MDRNKACLLVGFGWCWRFDPGDGRPALHQLAHTSLESWNYLPQGITLAGGGAFDSRQVGNSRLHTAGVCRHVDNATEYGYDWYMRSSADVQVGVDLPWRLSRWLLLSSWIDVHQVTSSGRRRLLSNQLLFETSYSH